MKRDPVIWGIRPRVGQKTSGEASPTQAVALDPESGSVVVRLEWAEVDHEWLFAYGRLPTKWVKLEDPDADVSAWLPQQMEWAKLKKAGDRSNYHASQVRQVGTVWMRVTRVPDSESIEGVQDGDIVVVPLGGSGDNLAQLLVRAMNNKGAHRVFRLPTTTLSELRSGTKPDSDAFEVARIYREQPGLFYPVDELAVQMIRISNLWQMLQRVMSWRIVAGQHLALLATNRAYQGVLGDKVVEVTSWVTAQTTGDEDFVRLQEREAALEGELLAALAETDVFRKVLDPIKGIGPRLGARIVASIIDVTRFEVQVDRREAERLEREAADLMARLGFDARRDEVVAWHWQRRLAHVFEPVATMDGWRDFTDRATAVRWARLEIVDIVARREVEMRFSRLVTFGELPLLSRVQVFRNFLEAENVTGQPIELLGRAEGLARRRMRLRQQARKRTADKVVRYAGAGTLDGEFMRSARGGGGSGKYDRTLRQGVYLFFIQMIKSPPDTPWRIKLEEIRTRLRQRHPYAVQVRKELMETFRWLDRELFKRGHHVNAEGLRLERGDDLLSVVGFFDNVDDLRHDLADRLSRIALKEGKVKLTPVFGDGHIWKMSCWKLATAFLRHVVGEWLDLAHRTRAATAVSRV